MISKERISTALLDIDHWLPNYIGLPYKHLGNDRNGIDCFNLPRLVYKEVLNEEIPYSTQDSGCDVDINWYSRTETANILIDRAKAQWGWQIVDVPQPFDIILLSIGATNSPNHCALFLNNKRILQVADGHPSWVTKYGKHYQQYTIKIGRWNRYLYKGSNE
jgi:cell wall-associated NlpC family hydrolase